MYIKVHPSYVLIIISHIFPGPIERLVLLQMRSLTQSIRFIRLGALCIIAPRLLFGHHQEVRMVCRTIYFLRTSCVMCSIYLELYVNSCHAKCNIQYISIFDPLRIHRQLKTILFETRTGLYCIVNAMTADVMTTPRYPVFGVDRKIWNYLPSLYILFMILYIRLYVCIHQVVLVIFKIRNFRQCIGNIVKCWICAFRRRIIFQIQVNLRICYCSYF